MMKTREDGDRTISMMTRTMMMIPHGRLEKRLSRSLMRLLLAASRSLMTTGSSMLTFSLEDLLKEMIM